MASKLVDSSIALYQAVSSKMLPTPSKSHYTFNLRDLSGVFQGFCMVHKESLVDQNAVLRLWGHESARNFRDRLVDEEDRGWFDSRLGQMAKETFNVNWLSI